MLRGFIGWLGLSEHVEIDEDGFICVSENYKGVGMDWVLMYWKLYPVIILSEGSTSWKSISYPPQGWIQHGLFPRFHVFPRFHCSQTGQVQYTYCNF